MCNNCNSAYLPIIVDIKLSEDYKHPIPFYATENSAGLDLYANIPNRQIILKPMSRILVPTGIFMALPPLYEAQIRPRSGLALKHGITVLNSPGTIDADYRGEIKVLLVNLSDTSFTINDGERIAQMVIARHSQVSLNVVPSLSETARGEGGFGHTGVK